VCPAASVRSTTLEIEPGPDIDHRSLAALSRTASVKSTTGSAARVPSRQLNHSSAALVSSAVDHVCGPVVQFKLGADRYETHPRPRTVTWNGSVQYRGGDLAASTSPTEDDQGCAAVGVLRCRSEIARRRSTGNLACPIFDLSSGSGLKTKFDEYTPTDDHEQDGQATWRNRKGPILCPAAWTRPFR